jgi:hypothetical protein
MPPINALQSALANLKSAVDNTSPNVSSVAVQASVNHIEAAIDALKQQVGNLDPVAQRLPSEGAGVGPIPPSANRTY